MNKNLLIPIISSTLVVLVLSLLTGSRQAEAPRSGQGFVMGYSTMWKRLTQLLFIAPVGIAIACVISPPKPEEWWLPYAIVGGFLAMLVPLAVEVFRHTVRVDDTGVHNFSAFGAPVFLAWKDIADVGFTMSSEVELRSRQGQRIRISLFLSGLGSLSEAMSRHLSHLSGLPAITQRIK